MKVNNKLKNSIMENLKKNSTVKDIEFTHYWVSGFGWKTTIFQPEDFIEVEKLGENKEDGIVFIAINDSRG